MVNRWSTIAVPLCALALWGASFWRTCPAETVTPPAASDGASVVRLPPIEPSVANTIDDSTLHQVEPPGDYQWRDHPFSTGYQVGWLIGGPFAKGSSDVPNGIQLTKRYGWDFDDHWGMEIRLADGYQSESNRFEPTMQSERILFGDWELLYYPLGDSRVRPYTILGAGVADVKFIDHDQQRVHEVLFDLPFGIGVKYPVTHWFAVRAELIDNLSLAGGELPTMDNLSLTGGGEIRFGDLRTTLIPWLKNFCPGE